MTYTGSFNDFWDDVVSAFRQVAIDDPMDGGPLDDVNDHVTGPTTDQNLSAQYAFPVIWSVPEGHTPDYTTTASDQGDLRVRVVTFAADTDPEAAFDRARMFGGHVVDAVEANRSLVVDGDAHAEGVWLSDFQMDFRVTTGNERAQVKYCQMFFDIGVKRRT